MKKQFVFTTLLLVLFAVCNGVSAQEALKSRPSPLSLTTMKYEDTYVKITYGRPHKKDRAIFDALVPYGKVWRLGANEATEITVTEPIKLGGKTLEPGTYSLFAIPEANEWTIIVNEDLGQWGAYRYNEKKDVFRVPASVSKGSTVYEPFTIEFEQKGVKKTNLLFKWDNVQASLPVEF